MWLESQRPFLELLRICGKKQRKALLKSIEKKQLQALSEIVHNVIRGTIVLTTSEKKVLKRYRKSLNKLGRKRATRRERLDSLEKNPGAVQKLLEIVGSSPWTR